MRQFVVIDSEYDSIEISFVGSKKSFSIKPDALKVILEVAYRKNKIDLKRIFKKQRDASN